MRILEQQSTPVSPWPIKDASDVHLWFRSGLRQGTLQLLGGVVALEALTPATVWRKKHLNGLHISLKAAIISITWALFFSPHFFLSLNLPLKYLHPGICEQPVSLTVLANSKVRSLPHDCVYHNITIPYNEFIFRCMWLPLFMRNVWNASTQ